MAMSNHAQQSRLMGLPVPVVWQGWRSDTLTLQSAGWRMFVSSDPMTFSDRIVFWNGELEVSGISDAYDRLQFRSIRDHREIPPIRVNNVGRISTIKMPEPRGLDQAFEVDCAPYLSIEPERDLYEYGFFRPKSQETTYIEAADMSVVELLQAIKDKQKPKQEEIRERMLRGELSAGQDLGQVVQLEAA